MPAEPPPYDVVIVGAGPAGLSAALVLGRCLRRVLICDSGTPRNARSRALNGYLTRDGMPPLEFLQRGRDELARYEIEWRSATVEDVQKGADGFSVLFESGERVRSGSVLLATGVRDHLPAIPGIDDCYGTSVHHCPYCDGWEVRGRQLVALGETTSPAGLALSLLTWSRRIAVCTNGASAARPSAAQRRQLARAGIPLYDGSIERLEHQDGRLERVVFEDGDTLPCDAMFFTAPQSQQCELARQLGCEFTPKGVVKTDHLGRSCVAGLYVVGDASRDVQFVIVAAAEGAKAGVAINKALQAQAEPSPARRGTPHENAAAAGTRG
jgi:thioredoxin reductase